MHLANIAALSEFSPVPVGPFILASSEYRMIAPAAGPSLDPSHTLILANVLHGVLDRVLSSILLQHHCHLPIPTEDIQGSSTRH